MKLSTFVKKVIAIHTGRVDTGIYSRSQFVCNNAKVAKYILCDATKNPKLIEQYQQYENACIAFVNKAIQGNGTVTIYLQYINDNTTNPNEFRLAMLNDMLEWASASELESKSKD